jgi:hypothetical protein
MRIWKSGNLMSILTTSRGARRGIFSAVAFGAALAVLTPMAANAAPWISRGEGRLLVVTLGGSEIPGILNLAGAVAEVPDGGTDQFDDQPLDATALGLVNVQLPVTNIPLFGNIIRLGAVGQYAQALTDGSSAAFSGTVSQANSLIGVSTVTPSGTTDPPAAGDSATIEIGTSDILAGPDLVALGIHIGAVAASATQAASDTGAGAKVGDYRLADVSVTVGGTVVGPVLGTLEGPLDLLVGIAAGLGIPLTNPIDNGTIVVTEDALLAAAGVADLNDLPVGTDLLALIPQALVAQVTTSVNALLAAAGANPLLAIPVAVAQGVVGPILATLAATLSGPLATAIAALAQLTVNNQTNNPDGSFTQNAITLGVGPQGSIATVELANATVGPNSGIVGVPIANTESVLIAGGIAVAAAGVVGLVMIRRRRILGAVADVR